MEQTTWGWLIVIYLFLGGLGSGAFIFATLAYKGILGDVDNKFYKFGFLMSPIFLIVGTALLLLDLAPSVALNPLKIIGLYTRPVSIMSIGTYLLTFFIVVSMLVFLNEKRGKICDSILSLGLILAIGVMGYTGLLLYAAKAIPLWNSIWIPIVFIISALSTGLSINVISLITNSKPITHKIHSIHTMIVFLETIAVIMLFAMVGSSDAGYASIIKITTGSLSIVFWVGFVLLGLVSPLVSGAKYILFQNSVRLINTNEVCACETKGCIFAEIGVLIAGFCLRAFIVFGAFYIF